VRTVAGEITRRRFVRIAASVAAFGTAGLICPRSFARPQPAPLVWRGLVLGNLASIEISHTDQAQASRVLEFARKEMVRLEMIMSLYRGDSALSVLNARGVLADPPLDLVRVLAESRRLGEVTAGAFDVTVQPLWKVYADHFAAAGADPAGPSSDAIRRAVEYVDYRVIEIEPSGVGLRRPGMALTLNGIAQGYITDRIAELLRNEGLENVLVDLGEVRTMGRRPDAKPWRAGIEDADRYGLVTQVTLMDQALSTSGSYGFRFDPAGRFHHIFDPRSGTCPQLHASVSVIATKSTVADAVATACNLTPLTAIPDLLRAAGASRALVVGLDGRSVWIEA
jgi:thiamine biosynthesis lipoprotein